MPSTGSQTSVRPFSGLKNRKREPQEEEGPSKKAKYSDSVIVISSSSETDTTPVVIQILTNTTSRKRAREDQDDHKTTKEVKVASPNLNTSSGSWSGGSVDCDKRNEFNTKYEEERKLGEGGFGAVYAGRRIADNLPVAIKHIKQEDVERWVMKVDGDVRLVPREVRLLQNLQSIPAVVKLLDWYDFPDQLILVLDRPDPCEDLLAFVHNNNGSLKECDAKIIVEQLVDALIQIHAHGVFHRDIKLQNILIETCSSIPRVRVIDFGCGTILSKYMYVGGPGTYQYQSPEWVLTGKYNAEPATVWQVGVTLFRLLHECYPRVGSASDSVLRIVFNSELSKDCRDFLHSCFIKDPSDRATLQGLQQHPWLTTGEPQPTRP